MKKCCLLLVLIGLTIACGPKKAPPEHLVQEDTYVDLMVELRLLRTYQEFSSADSARIDSLIQAVFNKYDVSRQQFKQNHAYYQNHLEEQKKRIDKAIEQLRKDRVYKADSTATDSTTADSASTASK